MARCADAVSYLQKSGQYRGGGGGSFAYSTESDVKREFRRAFARHGILFSISEESIETNPHKKADGSNSGYLTTVSLKFTLTHVESGEWLEFRGSGTGYDSTDKSVGKAYSYAVKTWLLNSFLVETGEDNERDDNDEQIHAEAIEDSFTQLRKKLMAMRPAQEKGKTGPGARAYADALAKFKSRSGHEVTHTSEFVNRADAVACRIFLERLIEQWVKEDFEAEGPQKASIHGVDPPDPKKSRRTKAAKKSPSAGSPDGTEQPEQASRDADSGCSLADFTEEEQQMVREWLGQEHGPQTPEEADAYLAKCGKNPGQVIEEMRAWRESR